MSLTGPSRREWLENEAIDIVAGGRRPSFYDLQHRLQAAGASHREANETIFTLKRRGEIKTTMTGRFVLPNDPGGGGGIGQALGIIAAILGIIASVLGIWEIGARNGIIPGPGPLEIVFPTPGPHSTLGPTLTFPPLTTGPPLTAPKISISGTCPKYTITWKAIDGAEKYTIRVNDQFRGTVAGTSYTLRAEELFGDGEVTVTATALTRPDSPPSNAVLAKDC
jgi:hypothetical protein